MTAFTGFPSGKNPYVPVPEVFFTELLPEIEDGAELKVTLHLFWLLARKQGEPRCVSDQELLVDKALLRGLKRRGDPRPVEERLRQGLEKSVARGTILRVQLRMLSSDGDQDEAISWYFFNTARSRKVVTRLQGGELVPVRLLELEEERVEEKHEVAVPAGGNGLSRGQEHAHNIQIQIERPNIFVLYEQNIGVLTPFLAEELRDAADRYPVDWIESAFREAVEMNKRNWRYIRAILRRWETEGR
jgi:DnaD/phage-associated family protein